VKLDFFAYRRFVLAYGLGNGGFGGTIHNAGKDDTSFL
jgi:hypothetical protein